MLSYKLKSQITANNNSIAIRDNHNPNLRRLLLIVRIMEYYGAAWPIRVLFATIIAWLLQITLITYALKNKFQSSEYMQVHYYRVINKT